KVFENQVSEAAAWVLTRGADRQLVVDKLYEIATANGLVNGIGDDQIQRILGTAFEPQKTAPPKPKNGSRASPDQSAAGTSLIFACISEVEALPIAWVW